MGKQQDIRLSGSTDIISNCTIHVHYKISVQTLKFWDSHWHADMGISMTRLLTTVASSGASTLIRAQEMLESFRAAVILWQPQPAAGSAATLPMTT